jgi:hypothetical protein
MRGKQTGQPWSPDEENADPPTRGLGGFILLWTLVLAGISLTIWLLLVSLPGVLPGLFE